MNALRALHIVSEPGIRTIAGMLPGPAPKHAVRSSSGSREEGVPVAAQYARRLRPFPPCPRRSGSAIASNRLGLPT